MHPLEVGAGVADAPVSPCLLAPLQFRQGAMHAHEKHVVRGEELHQVAQGFWRFQDVIHDQVVACSGEGGQRAVVAAKQSGALPRPPEGVHAGASGHNFPTEQQQIEREV